MRPYIYAEAVGYRRQAVSKSVYVTCHSAMSPNAAIPRSLQLVPRAVYRQFLRKSIDNRGRPISGEIAPTFFVGVPRIYEKAAAAIFLFKPRRGGAGGLRQTEFCEGVLCAGTQIVGSAAGRKPRPCSHRAAYALLYILLFRNIQRASWIWAAARHRLCAGASISPENVAVSSDIIGTPGIARLRP